MSAGTLTFQRFNGTERFAIERAELFFVEREGSPWLSFDFDADRTPLLTLPDTEALHALPGGEFNVNVPGVDLDGLVGKVFSIPHGDDDGDWLARIYYVEHDAAKNCTIRIVERDADRFRIAADGYCTDLNFYDGSKPDTHFVLEAWFILRR